MLKPLQLSKEDQRSFIAALRGVQAQLAFVAREEERLSSSRERSEARFTDMRLQRTRILSEAQVRLTATLGSEALVRLDSYIKTQVKPRITIYGDAPQ